MNGSQSISRNNTNVGTGLGLGSSSSRGTGKRSQRDVIVDLLKAEIVLEGRSNKLSHKTIIAACEEAGCRNPNAMLHQLNEYGVLLQCGDKYTLRGV